MDTAEFVFQKMDLGAALAVVQWEYPTPHHVYNLHGSILAITRLVDGPYFSVYFGEELMGFFCYGAAAQLKVGKGHVLYVSREYLDIGLGMHPAWCGRGLGVEFVRSGLVFAKDQDWRGGFRLTVAANNARAYAVYSRLGFKAIGSISWDDRFSSDFVVMTLDEFGPTPAES